MNKSNEWWRTFFSGMTVDFWLRATTEEQTRLEADFIQQTLQVSAPAKMLDVPCGGGRHALALAARGFQLVGVDISTDFLTAARAGSQARALPVVWEQRDMRDLPWTREFDGAYSFGNSFGYLDEAGNLDFLKAVARTLKAGAAFVMETAYITECLFPNLQERGWYPIGDILVLSSRRYDPVECRLHVEYTMIRDGHTEKRAMSARLHSYREVAHMLETAGFVDVQGWSSFNKEPFKLGSPRLLITARTKKN